MVILQVLVVGTTYVGEPAFPHLAADLKGSSHCKSQ